MHIYILPYFVTMKKFILGGAIAFFLYKFVKGKMDLANNVTFDFVDISLRGSFPVSKVILTISVNNPTSNTATIDDVQGDLYLNGIKVGKASFENTLRIAANTKNNVDINIFLDNFSSISTVYAAISNKTANFKFDGFVEANNLTIPVIYTYKLI